MVDETPLIIDARKDLELIDPFVNKLINDTDMQKRFFYNPSGVMIEEGLHPPATENTVAITNRMFYEVLSNEKLIKFVTENMPSIQIPEDQKQILKSSLKQGKIQNAVDSDVLALDAYLKNENLMKEIITMVLEDLNEKGVFTVSFSVEKLHSYVDDILKFLRERKAVVETPALLKMGPGANYGIGAKEGPDTVTLQPEDPGQKFDSTMAAHGGHVDSSGGVGGNAVFAGLAVEVVVAGTAVLVVEVAIPASVFGKTPQPKGGRPLDVPEGTINQGLTDPAELEAISREDKVAAAYSNEAFFLCQ